MVGVSSSLCEDGGRVVGSLSFACSVVVFVVVFGCSVVVAGFLVKGGAGVNVALPHLTNILLPLPEAVNKKA